MIKYKIGDWSIENERYINDFGFEADSMRIIKQNKDGTLTCYPIIGFPKANNLTEKSSIGEEGFNYTKKDLKQILEIKVKEFLNKNMLITKLNLFGSIQKGIKERIVFCWECGVALDRNFPNKYQTIPYIGGDRHYCYAHKRNYDFLEPLGSFQSRDYRYFKKVEVDENGKPIKTVK